MNLYVALLKSNDCYVNDVITVQEKFSDLEIFVKDFFGINENKFYTKPAKFLGYKKIEYSEFEDDLEGYFTFDEDGEISEVYVFCKKLNQKPCL